MVRAILDGRKTQTRRVCKPRFDDKNPCEHFAPVEYDVGPSMERHCEHGSESTPCPYGVVGDRLWVKETWAAWPIMNDTPPSQMYCQPVHYKATFDAASVTHAPAMPNKWRPSIFMPRWASRITLEVTGVRVERVQKISIDDVFEEGAADRRNCFPQEVGYIEGLYAKLWDSINDDRGFGWNVNPWVWVVEFKRVNL
jgi:hypothetical protein